MLRPKRLLLSVAAHGAETGREPGWRYVELDASHSPNVTPPEALMEMLQEIVAERA
jgi:hypothetical protein